MLWLALEHVKNAGMDPYLNITVGHYNANTDHFKQLLDYSKQKIQDTFKRCCACRHVAKNG